MSVTLRRKKLSDGRLSFYLDVYHNGKRSYEFLKLYLGKDRQANKETMRLAESVRAKKELDLNSRPHGFVPEFRQQVCFVEFFERIARSKNESDTAWRNTLVHLKKFTGGALRLLAVDERWLEAFRDYLLEQVAQATARVYFSKVRAALRQAMRKRLIARNPAEHVDHVARVESKREYLVLERGAVPGWCIVQVPGRSSGLSSTKSKQRWARGCRTSQQAVCYHSVTTASASKVAAMLAFS